MTSNLDDLKMNAAQAALDYLLPQLTNDTVLGIGSGSTTACFIDLLAQYKHRFAGAVAASRSSTNRLTRLGISVFNLNHIDSLRFYVDGADESNSKLQLIKGGGAALTREKLIASVADEFICIADESKWVETLGRFPLPLEIIPMARTFITNEVTKLGGTAVFRKGVTTDNGNKIIDVHGLHITDPLAMEQQLNQLPGLVCNGIFAMRPADRIIIASPSRVMTRRASND